MVKKILISSLAATCLLSAGIVAADSEKSIKQQVEDADRHIRKNIEKLPKSQQAELKRRLKEDNKYYEKTLREGIEVDPQKVEAALRSYYKGKCPSKKAQRPGEVQACSLAYNPKKIHPKGVSGAFFVSWDQTTKGFNHGHAGIVAPHDDHIIESDMGIGVQKKKNPKTGWNERMKKWAGYLMANASVWHYEKAAHWAESSVGKMYNMNFYDRWRTTQYYCSQLVWRSWKNQGYDLSHYVSDSINGPVYPFDISNSKKAITYYTKGFKKK